MVGENVGVGSGGVDLSTAGPLFFYRSAWSSACMTCTHQPITVTRALTVSDEIKAKFYQQVWIILKIKEHLPDPSAELLLVCVYFPQVLFNHSNLSKGHVEHFTLGHI